MPRHRPLDDLPPGYEQVYHLSVTENNRALLWLNGLGLLTALATGVVAFGWYFLLQSLRAPWPGGESPWWLLSVLIILVIALHEWLHGLAIRYYGGWPRYGAIPRKFVVYATADAYFYRDPFIAIALAPLVVLTGAGLLLMPLLPDVHALNVALLVVANGAGAAGDIWMAYVARRYGRDTLILDEADSIRVFVRQSD